VPGLFPKSTPLLIVTVVIIIGGGGGGRGSRGAGHGGGCVGRSSSSRNDWSSNITSTRSQRSVRINSLEQRKPFGWIS